MLNAQIDPRKRPAIVEEMHSLIAKVRRQRYTGLLGLKAYKLSITICKITMSQSLVEYRRLAYVLVPYLS